MTTDLPVQHTDRRLLLNHKFLCRIFHIKLGQFLGRQRIGQPHQRAVAFALFLLAFLDYFGVRSTAANQATVSLSWSTSCSALCRTDYASRCTCGDKTISRNAWTGHPFSDNSFSTADKSSGAGCGLRGFMIST